MGDDRDVLRLFVYGTLKRGLENHRRYCGGMLDAEVAQVRGRLFLLPHGHYPILQVEEGAIVARGSHDYVADLRLFGQLAGHCETASEGTGGGEDGVVEGEVLTFADAAATLRRLDRLESFRLDGCGEYVRVIVRTHPHGEPVWAYVAPPNWSPSQSQPLQLRWP